MWREENFTQRIYEIGLWFQDQYYENLNSALARTMCISGMSWQPMEQWLHNWFKAKDHRSKSNAIFTWDSSSRRIFHLIWSVMKQVKQIRVKLSRAQVGLIHRQKDASRDMCVVFRESFVSYITMVTIDSQAKPIFRGNKEMSQPVIDLKLCYS